MGFAPAVGARGCSDGPSVGALALQGELLERYASRGLRSLGIFNCRRIAGSSSWSLHAEGRALDIGGVLDGLSQRAAAAECLVLLLAAGNQVLQRVIFAGGVYDAATPAGRPLAPDANQHHDHLHIELSWAAAAGSIPLELIDVDDQEDEMPGLLVAYNGAQWLVSSDLSGRVGLSQSDDVRALLAAGYRAATLTPGLMGKIPVTA